MSKAQDKLFLKKTVFALQRRGIDNPAFFYEIALLENQAVRHHQPYKYQNPPRTPSIGIGLQVTQWEGVLRRILKKTQIILFRL